jgi:hypothetical protein
VCGCVLASSTSNSSLPPSKVDNDGSGGGAEQKDAYYLAFLSGLVSTPAVPRTRLVDKGETGEEEGEEGHCHQHR